MIPLRLEEIVGVIGAQIGDETARRVAVQSGSVSGVTTDSRSVRAGELFFAIRGERHDGHTFVPDALRAGAIAAVVRRGYRPPEEADGAILLDVADPVAALGALGRFHRRQLAAEVVAVTGSNGKTTTKAMIVHVLQARFRGRGSAKSFNNNIGVPLTLLSADAADEFLVAEVGTNAPGEIDALGRLIEPEVAVITGIAPVHLERLGDLAAIAREKLSLLRHVRQGGCAIVNVDVPEVRERLAAITKRTGRPAADDVLSATLKIVTIGRHADADLRLTDVRVVRTGSDNGDGGTDAASDAGPLIEFVVNDKFRYQLGVLGEHNAINALAAIAVGRRFGLDHDEIAARLGPAGGFALPSMRLEYRRGGPDGAIEVINDAYNANPASVAAAIDVLRAYPRKAEGRRVIVLGEMRELGPSAGEFHEDAGRRAAESGIDVLFAIGPYADRMAATARDLSRQKRSSMEVHTAPDADAAVRRIGSLCRPGDVVLIKGSRALGLERVADALMHHGKN